MHAHSHAQPRPFDSELAEQASAELTPVAAIVGGVAAQEIVKAVSAKGAVLLNCFYYDGTTGTGDIETLLQE